MHIYYATDISYWGGGAEGKPGYERKAIFPFLRFCKLPFEGDSLVFALRILIVCISKVQLALRCSPNA